jgi:pSer/pThr/pTyr-binding forkhead associated (FHA) protein
MQSDSAPGGAAGGVPQPKALPRRPFLIVDGERQMMLTRELVRMGRSREGDVVIDDRRVSRNHAELRWQGNTQRYLLVDLGSTGGTRINGYPVAQCPLEAGDIISLGGVELIYGEELALDASAVVDGTTGSVVSDA